MMENKPIRKTFECIGEPTSEELAELSDKMFGGKELVSCMPHRNCILYSEKQEDGSRKVTAKPIESNKPMDVSGLNYSSFKPDDTSIESQKTIQKYL